MLHAVENAIAILGAPVKCPLNADFATSALDFSINGCCAPAAGLSSLLPIVLITLFELRIIGSKL